MTGKVPTEREKQLVRAAVQMERDKARVLEELARLIVKLVKLLLPGMKESERLVFWTTLTHGYCPHCGHETKDLPCYCQNDV